MKRAEDSRWLLVLLVACGGARGGGPPQGAMEKAVTVVDPDGARCPDEVGDTRAVVILVAPGKAVPVGRVTATRHHHSEDEACAWAEDGAASAARRLGGDAVVVTSRSPGEDDDGAKCTVKARVLLRGGGEILRPCKRERFRGVAEP